MGNKRIQTQKSLKMCQKFTFLPINNPKNKGSRNFCTLQELKEIILKTTHKHKSEK